MFDPVQHQGLKDAFIFYYMSSTRKHSLCKQFKHYKKLKSILDLPLLWPPMLSFISFTIWLN